MIKISKYGICENCMQDGVVELHHIIKRSQAKYLEKCELNFINLCPNCHRSEKGVHGREGTKLDKSIKLQMQNKAEIILDKQYFTRQEIQELLNINNKATDSLCKTIKQEKGVFSREECLKAIMGGRIIEELEDIE